MPTAVKVKRIHPEAVIPKYEHEGDAGVDLHAVEPAVIKRGERALIKTGIQVAIPKGFELQIRPRSGLALKEGITVLNTPGTIDAGYRGEIGVILMNHGVKDFTVAAGMRIAQMVLNQVEEASFQEVEELDATTRGAGGFGSTGTRG